VYYSGGGGDCIEEEGIMSTIMIIIVLAHIFLMASTLCAAFIIQQPYRSIYNTNCFIPSSCHNLQSVSYRLYASSSTNNNNDDKDTTTIFKVKDELATHYTSKSILSWLQKMADSYQIEEGEELLTVLTREGSIIVDDTKNNIEDDTSQLLKLAKLCAQTNLSIASHDFLRSNDEAIYNYGNIAFLSYFGYEWDEFVELPSSKCVATQEDVTERQKLLDARLSNKVSSRSNDDTDDDTQYDNLIRVRKDGTQIVLKGVHLWNVYDITLQQQGEDDEDSRSSKPEEVIRIRRQIEQGELKAIGQAVWISNVETL